MKAQGRNCLGGIWRKRNKMSYDLKYVLTQLGNTEFVGFKIPQVV